MMLFNVVNCKLCLYVTTNQRLSFAGDFEISNETFPVPETNTVCKLLFFFVAAFVVNRAFKS